MRNVFCISILVILSGSLSAQTKNTRDRNASRTVFEGQPSSVRLAPHVTTTIRLPEPVNSVVLGDSNLFQAEYSPNEPLLVFARPTASANAQTNLVISTVFGRQFILLLRSLGASAGEGESGVDLLVTCQVAQVRFIEETFPSALISETVNLGKATPPNASDKTDVASESGLALDEILNRQRHRRMEKRYGEGIRVGIGQIAEDGSRWIVSFSVVNSKSETAELVPPQVQLSGQTKAGIFRRSHWTTVQQVPVQIYELSPRRLNPGGRADGVVVFERPPIQQSTEKLMLQIADSAAVDQPALAPIRRQTQPLEKNHE